MFNNQQSHPLRILQWNARSIKYKINELSKHCDGFDIIYISETWLTFDMTIRLRGYDVIREDRVGQKGLDFHQQKH